MAVALPDYTALGEKAPPQPSGGVAAYEPPNWKQVGMAGQVLTQAGQQEQGAAGIMADAAQRQDSIVAQSAANTTSQLRMSLEFDPQSGFRNLKEGATVGPQFINDWTSKFNDQTQAIRQNLMNDNQRRIYDQHLQVESQRYQSDLMTHQAQETDRFNDSTDNATVSGALQEMAARPTDELSFQTGLAKINGTIDAMAVRKGWVNPDGTPNQIATQAKTKYLDAAYATRITSIMDGVPGVVDASPYLAEKMFQQVQSQLQPESQIRLAAQVQHSVQQVQQRDISAAVLAGKAPTDPNSLLPAIDGSKPLQAVVQDMESGGRRYATDGLILTSPKGAQGEMQVMPTTAANPGFGVRPAQNGSPEELVRVGRDFLGAMTARYNDAGLALAAYNAGPGQVDKWLVKFGDPRSGQISDADFVAKIPFDETRNYVANGLSKLGQQPAPQAPPTASQLKTQLPALAAQARDVWTRMYPNDPVGADAVFSRVMSYGQVALAGQQAQQSAARDTLYQGIVGSKPDGSDAPRTVDQLLANPAMKAAWDQATPEAQLTIQQHFKAGGGDVPRTADTQKLLYQMTGMYSNNRQAFADADLTPLIAQLPHADFDKLSNLQVAARNKQELAQDKQLNLDHALGVAQRFALAPLGIFTPTKDTPQNKRQLYDEFTGALRDQLDTFQQANKRPPNDQEIAAMAKNLTTQVQVPGKWWGTTPKSAFEITPDQAGQVTATVPDAFRTGITAALTKAQGKPPTEAQVQSAYFLSLRNPPKPKAAPSNVVGGAQ